MQIRDRIKKFARVKAASLRPNPKNWRTHPQAQQDALRGMLAEVGIADAVIAFPADGLGPKGDFKNLMLLDGHLRVDTLPDQLVPVLVTDLTAEEADKVLATLDPLAGMAEADPEKLKDLLNTVESESEAVQQLLAELAEANGIEEPAEDDTAGGEGTGEDVPESFQLVVELDTEDKQKELFARLKGEGYSCRVLTM